MSEEICVKIDLGFLNKKAFHFKNQRELVYLCIGRSKGSFQIDKSEIKKVRFVKFDKVLDFIYYFINLL